LCSLIIIFEEEYIPETSEQLEKKRLFFKLS